MKIFFAIVILLIIIGLWLQYNHDSMRKESLQNIFSDVNTTPSKKVALLLGTSKFVASGKLNYFYTYRIEATAELFKAKKVKAILISGDNSLEHYNEPESMRDDLIKLGVPKEHITLDYAGFRTLDSLVRANVVFGIDDYIIVTQRFHLERALYLAHKKGYKAIGFVAKDLKGTPSAYRMKARELGARAKAVLDVYANTQPRFYGEKIEVNISD